MTVKEMSWARHDDDEGESTAQSKNYIATITSRYTGMFYDSIFRE
jgi:hypothetical protein